MKADIPAVTIFIDRILELRQAQQDLGRQVTQVYKDAQAAGVERGALQMAINAITLRTKAAKSATLDALDDTAKMANAFLGEYYRK